MLKMTCSDGAETRAATSSDPGGLSADAISGAVSGTPQREGDNFHMQLRAVDADNSAAVVAEWHFNVRDPIFGSSSAWTGTYESNPSRGILSRYHVGQFHTLRPPALDKEHLFVFPANNNFDGIGASLPHLGMICVHASWLGCVPPSLTCCMCVCVRVSVCLVYPCRIAAT